MDILSKEQKAETFTKLSLLVILISNFFRSIGFSIVDIGLPYFIVSLSGTLMSFGIIIGIFSVTQAILQVPFAAASDRFGRKKIILLGILVYALGTFLCYLAQDIVQLIIFRAIQGAGAYNSILQAIVGDMFEEKEQGKGMSYFSVSFTFGYFGGVSLGGYISFYLGFRSVFFVSSVMAAISGILILFFFKEYKTRDMNINQEKQVNYKKNGMNFSDIKLLLKNNQYNISVLINCMRFLLFGGIVAYIVWIFEFHFLLDQIQTSYILIFIVAVYILFVLITGKLVDRFGAKKIMVLGQAIIVCFGSLYFIVHMTNNLTLFVLASLLSGVGLGLFETSGNTNLLKKIEKINPELKGAGFGVNNTIGFLLTAIGPIVLALMGEISLFLPYYFIFFYVMVSLSITHFFVKG